VLASFLATWLSAARVEVELARSGTSTGSIVAIIAARAFAAHARVSWAGLIRYTVDRTSQGAMSRRV